MDRVRFGRALGYGARHAAKSLMKAADAASSPNPSAAQPSTPGRSRTGSGPAISQPTVSRVVERVVETRRTVAQTKKHAGRLGRSVWSPLARFSGVLWLQVTGTFFTLLAVFLSQGLWKQRGAMGLPIHSHAAAMFYLQLAAFVGFTYFAISNFVRAYLRERR